MRGIRRNQNWNYSYYKASINIKANKPIICVAQHAWKTGQIDLIRLKYHRMSMLLSMKTPLISHIKAQECITRCSLGPQQLGDDTPNNINSKSSHATLEIIITETQSFDSSDRFQIKTFLWFNWGLLWMNLLIFLVNSIGKRTILLAVNMLMLSSFQSSTVKGGETVLRSHIFMHQNSWCLLKLCCYLKGTNWQVTFVIVSHILFQDRFLYTDGILEILVGILTSYHAL